MLLCAGAVEVADPAELVRDYVDPRNDYAYPAYDRLVTNGTAEVVDGDLLAPALLNAPVDRTRFSVLRAMLPQLRRVADLPPVALSEAGDDVLDQVSRLFDVLDDDRDRRSGVRGTIVAKVLHRKRPDLVPLYDSVIFEAYTRTAILRLEHRSWVEFMRQLCTAMRSDLQHESAAFDALVAVARNAGAQLSRLRLLDILVWRTESEWL